ncbi:MAG: hypothetical protein IKK09_10560 [Clostridia bacterium]|nr:hypothetical protein [Clostridia bacterium]
MINEGAVFFLAANSAQGFFSLFNELYEPDEGWKAYIIKGGPGTGKSGLMRKIAQAAEDRGYTVERIICSSDPDSLDAVIIPEKKICFADGTAPHVMEARYPGAVEEIINLGQFWNSKMLESNREHIITLTNCNKALHTKSARYVSAYFQSVSDSANIAKAAVDYKKIDNFASRFIVRNCQCSNRLGAQKNRLLNGITPKGYVTLFNTAKHFCDRIYAVNDEDTYISSVLMESLRRCAVSNGIDVISCLNPLSPEGNPLHIILPEERIGFFTSNSVHNFKSIAYKNINTSRFVNRDIIAAHKQRLVFNRKVSSEMLSEAIKLLEKAKKVHDDLEADYIKAMDFNELNKYTENLIESIF